MDLNITKKEKNEVFKRQEVVAETSEKITPSKEVVQEKLAALLNVPKEQIVVSKIETGFGDQKATIYARAYESEEQLKEIEPKYMVSRNFKEAPKAESVQKGEEKKEEAAPAEEKTEEAPKEEKADEVKEEKKDEPAKEEPAKEEKPEEVKEEPKAEEPKEEPKEEKKEGEQ